MNLEEIKTAVDAGRVVHWKNNGYTVVGDGRQYLIGWAVGTPQSHYVGLTWLDGVTMNGDPGDFYIEETEG